MIRNLLARERVQLLQPKENFQLLYSKCCFYTYSSVADPDLQIRGSGEGGEQGGGHPDPELRGKGSPSGHSCLV